MEYFDVLKEDGTKTGIVKERDQVHKDGDWHGSVHIWIIRDDKVLLQKRGADKESYPSCYDAACTGHVDAGEDYLTAAVRETKEEISIKSEKENFQFLFEQKLCFFSGAFISKEINQVYLLDESVDLEGLTYQKEEIEGLIWIGCDQLLFDLEQGSAQYCISLEEYRKVRNQFLSFK